MRAQGWVVDRGRDGGKVGPEQRCGESVRGGSSEGDRGEVLGYRGGEQAEYKCGTGMGGSAVSKGRGQHEGGMGGCQVLPSRPHQQQHRHSHFVAARLALAKRGRCGRLEGLGRAGGGGRCRVPPKIWAPLRGRIHIQRTGTRAEHLLMTLSSKTSVPPLQGPALPH